MFPEIRRDGESSTRTGANLAQEPTGERPVKETPELKAVFTDAANARIKFLDASCFLPSDDG
jgi:hypothetical protein